MKQILVLLLLVGTSGCSFLARDRHVFRTDTFTNSKWTSSLEYFSVARFVFDPDGTGKFVLAETVNERVPLRVFLFKWHVVKDSIIDCEIVRQDPHYTLKNLRATVWKNEIDVDFKFTEFTGLTHLKLVREEEFLGRFRRMEDLLNGK